MLFQTFLMILSFASLLSSNCPKFLTPSKKLLTLLFFSLRFLYAIVVSGGERPRSAVVRRSRCSVLCLCVLCDSNFQKKCEKFWTMYKPFQYRRNPLISCWSSSPDSSSTNGNRSEVSVNGVARRRSCSEVSVARVACRWSCSEF